MTKSVKVHDDTHRALKELKTLKRSKSIDEVVREMIRSTTGEPVGKKSREVSARLTSFVDS